MANKTEWEKYIRDYENNLPAPTPDTIADYAKQWAYLQWLKSIYKQYENDWENIPDTISMTAKTASGIYQSRLDHEFHAVIISPFSGESTVMAQSDEFTVTVSMETYSGGTLPEMSSEYYEDSQNIGVQSAILQSGYNVKQDLAGAPYFTDSTYNNGNTGSYFYTCIIYIPKTGTPGEQSQNTFGSAYSFIGSGSPATIGTGGLLTTITGDIDTANPWDYYNNDILPDIDPDNAAFPNGYNPIPEKPDPEFPDLPGDTENGGNDIEPNDTTGIGGGFGFLTQYAIRSTDIEILGKLLWAGFRTGSQQDIDDYLMNFVYNVNSDTGSLNFSDVMEFFVSLKMYPFPLGNVGTLTPHDHHIHVGAGYTAIGDNPNLPHFPNTIYTMDSYIGKISAGSVTLPFWFRDYRDYSIQVTLYLPYCGTVELNPGDVIGGTLDCDYYIDFCTGSCTAYVQCTTWDGHRFPVATMPGQIGADVPMTATNAGRIAARIYSDRINSVENMLGAVKAATTGLGAVMSGNYAGAIRQGFSAFIDPAINEEKLKAGMLERGAIAAPVLSAGGGFTSFCNSATCYVTYRSSLYPEIENYPDSVGTPATSQVIIGNCTGFCQFVNVDVTGITAEATAKNMIIDALAAGIFI